MLVRRAHMFPIECVARGYLSGSGWKEYRQKGTVCGIPLPTGLRESDRLPEPIFTPQGSRHGCGERCRLRHGQTGKGHCQPGSARHP